jgi:hypothetical protein
MEDSSLDPTLQGPYVTDFNLNYLTVPVVGELAFWFKKETGICIWALCGVLLNAKETAKDQCNKNL